MSVGVTDNAVMADRGYLVLTKYREVEEVLRRQKDFVSAGSRGEMAREFLDDTLVNLDGDAHFTQRRLLAKTMTDRCAAQYEQLVTDCVNEHLAGYAARIADGRAVQFDLVATARRIFWRLGSLMVGIDGVDDHERLERLEALVGPAGEGITVLFSYRDPEQVMTRARQAAAAFRREFYEPSRARRADLLKRVSQGELDRSALPTDMLSLMIEAHPGEEFDDQVYRQCLQALSASVGNTVGVTCHALAEVRAWLGRSASGVSQAVTPAFLAGVVDETVRLHRTGAPFLLRHSLVDTELASTGRPVPCGCAIAMNVREANRDPEIFGDDSAVFDPNRRPVGARVKGYGLGFGTGPHVCLAKRLIVSDEIDSRRPRVVDTVLGRLLEMGVAMTPDSAAVPEPHGAERFESFPVVMGPAFRVAVHDDRDRTGGADAGTGGDEDAQAR
jgi:cytochrome P450